MSASSGTLPPSAERGEYVVSVCTVADNDAAILQAFLREASEVLAKHFQYYEVVVVDNCSGDGSDALVRQTQQELPHIRLIRLSRRYGKDIGYAAALSNCIGDYVVTLNLRADPVALIPQMVARLGQGADIIFAYCTNPSRSWFTRIVAWVGRRFAEWALRVHFVPDAEYFCGFTRRAINSLTRIRSKSRFFRYVCQLVGYPQTTVPYERVWRDPKKTPADPLVVLIMGTIEAVIANSAVPLRFATLLGCVASLLNLLYLVYIVLVALLKDRVAPGWVTTSFSATVMFLVLFFILTVLSEYVARILEESKDQPLYFVEQETHSSVSSPEKDRLNVVSP